MGVPATMALKAVLLLATVALVSSQSSCNTDDRDCKCADKLFQDCQEPVTADMIHVADLAECKFQCDLFNSFGACDWFVYEQTGGMDENCHLFGPGKESMTDYSPAATGLVEPSATKTGSVLTVPTPFARAAPTARDVCPVLQIPVDCWLKQNVL